MADATVLGQGTFVRGRIHGSGDLLLQGRVEGEVTTSGEVTVDASGLVGANVSAGRIIVRGAVRGDLTAEDMLHVESGARVVGNLRAPRIAIAPGGLVRGHVATSGASKAPARAAARAVAVLPRTTTPPRHALSRGARPADDDGPTTLPRTAQAPERITVSGNHKPPRGSTLAGARPGPPPPVVPVLKKGTKAVQKKRG
jgi:cytoskeletal protein CcmA (bactofilin family)